MVKEAILPYAKVLFAGGANKPWVGLECRANSMTTLCAKAWDLHQNSIQARDPWVHQES